MDVNDVVGVKSDGSWPGHTCHVRLLLVDHNRASLLRTASQLQEQLYNVTTAESATMALKFFEAAKGSYDGVIADFDMEDMDIYQFIESISNQCLTTDMPIILMAKEYPMDLGEKALAKGASFFLQKPLSPGDIIQLWWQIAYVTGRIPGVTSTEMPKKRDLIIYDEENKNKKRSRNAQEVPNCADANFSHITARAHPLNYVGYTLSGVEQKVNELYSNKALNGTTGNQVADRGNKISTEGGHFYSNNVVNGSRAENIILNTGCNQVVGENGGVQILSMEGDQVTPTNGYVTAPGQDANQEVSVGFGNLGCMNTSRGTATSPHNIIDEFLSADDIADILRDV